MSVILAVLMLTWHGFKYTMSASGFVSKKEAISGIQNVFIGLLIIFGSYLLLESINPDLVKLTFLLDSKPLTPPTVNVTTGSPGSCEYEVALSNAKRASLAPGTWLKRPGACINKDGTDGKVYTYTRFGTEGTTEELNHCQRALGVYLDPQSKTTNKLGSIPYLEDVKGVHTGQYGELECITILGEDGSDITLLPGCPANPITEPQTVGLYQVKSERCKVANPNGGLRLGTTKHYTIADTCIPSDSTACEKYEYRYRDIAYHNVEKKYYTSSVAHAMNKRQCLLKLNRYRTTADQISDAGLIFPLTTVPTIIYKLSTDGTELSISTRDSYNLTKSASMTTSDVNQWIYSDLEAWCEYRVVQVPYEPYLKPLNNQ